MKIAIKIINNLLLILLTITIIYLLNMEYKHFLKLNIQTKLSIFNIEYLEKINFEEKRLSILLSLIDKNSTIYNYSNTCVNGIKSIPTLNNVITMKEYYYFVNSFSGFYCRHENEQLQQYDLESLNKEYVRPDVQVINYVSLKYEKDVNGEIERILSFQYNSLKTYNDILEVVVGDK